MVLTDTIGLRLELQLILFVLIGFSIYLVRNNHLDNISLMLLFTIVCLIVGELIFRGDFYDVIGYLLTFSLCYIALNMSKIRLLQSIDLLVAINTLFAILAIAGFVIAANNVDILFTMMERPELYSKEPLNGKNIYRLFGNIDTNNTFLGMAIPRMNGPLQQASLLPAYFILPLGIALAYSKVSLEKILIILFFILLTLSGNTYVGLFSAGLVFIFRRFVPKVIYNYFPFIVLFLTTFLIFTFYFDELAVADAGKETLENIGGAGGAESNVIFARIVSGLVRLAFIGKQFAGILHSFFLPANEDFVKLSLGSNLYTIGLIGGIFAMIPLSLIFFKLFTICSNGFNSLSTNKTQQFGFCLVYAMIFQSMVYNDFGFSTYYGFLMISIVLKLNFFDKQDAVK